MRKVLMHASAAAFALVLLAGCGDSSEETSDVDVEVTDADESTDGDPSSQVDEPPVTPAEDDGGPGDDASTATETAGSSSVEVDLVEWGITTETELAAGTVTFDITNSGKFPHKLGITKGESYESLPQSSDGVVDEAALGDDFLGDTENIASGDADSIDFDLEPGDYVLFCNIAVGPNSHAANGQVLSVTVS